MGFETGNILEPSMGCLLYTSVMSLTFPTPEPVNIPALPGCGSWRSAIWIRCRPCLSAPMTVSYTHLELREINDIMNNAVTGWRAFSNPRYFPEPYRRQKGWERIRNDNEPDNSMDGFQEMCIRDRGEDKANI